MGGAVAVLTAANLDSRESPVKGVYTYGAPRIGNNEFYFGYSAPTYRLVNSNDIIPHLPAEQFPIRGFEWLQYKHVGSLVYFDRHGVVGEGTTNWERKKSLICDYLRHIGQPPTQWFQDHPLSSYLDVIERNL